MHGATLKTDERTRVCLQLADGTGSSSITAPSSRSRRQPRQIAMTAGRVVADVAHVEQRPAAIATPSRPHRRARHALRRHRDRRAHHGPGRPRRGRADQRPAGTARRGPRRRGRPRSRAARSPSAPRRRSATASSAWSELGSAGQAPTRATAGLGELRAYKPGEKRDRDWNARAREARREGPHRRSGRAHRDHRDVPQRQRRDARGRLPVPAARRRADRRPRARRDDRVASRRRVRRQGARRARSGAA